MLSRRTSMLTLAVLATAIQLPQAEASLIGDSISLTASYQQTNFYGPIQATGSQSSLEWEVFPFIKVDIIDADTITAYMQLNAGSGLVGKSQGPIDLHFAGIDLGGGGLVSDVGIPTVVGTGSYSSLTVSGPDSIFLEGLQLAVGTHGSGENVSSITFDVELSELQTAVPEPASFLALAGLSLVGLSLRPRRRRT